MRLLGNAGTGSSGLRERVGWCHAAPAGVRPVPNRAQPEFTVANRIGRLGKTLKPGDSVQIRYLREDPATAILDQAGELPWLVLIVDIIGLMVIAYAFVKRRKAAIG